MSDQTQIDAEVSHITLAADKPIKAESDDKLGVATFADAIARSVIEMSPPEGLVISIEGPWGSGKTSVIELLSRSLIRRTVNQMGCGSDQATWESVETTWNDLAKDRPVHLVRFNPWLFSGQENLVKAFFNEIGVVLGTEAGPISRTIAKIRDGLPSFGAIVGGGITGAATSGIGTGAGATVGRAVGESTQKLFPADKSLEHLKIELATELRKVGKRVVVIIDDIDRLLPTEIRQMLSAVKALGDLPNVVYLLAFDREAVTRLLKTGADSIDDSFLEKIIQVTTKIPPASSSSLRSLLFTKLNGIVGEATPNDEIRWSAAFRESAIYLRTPRDVARLSNAFQVVWPSVQQEVDLTDLYLLTILQTFEPKIYDTLIANIERLVGVQDQLLDKKELAQQLETEAHLTDRTKLLVAYLFPRLNEPWNTHTYERGDELTRRSHRRVCTKEYFRNYLSLSPNPQRLSKAEMMALLRSTDPKSAFSTMLRDLSGNSNSQRIPELLEQIFEEVGQAPLLTKGLLIGLLDQSGSLIARKDLVFEFFMRDNLDRLRQILFFGLRSIPADQRSELVHVMADHNEGLVLAALFTELLASQHGLFGGKGDFEQIVPKDCVEAAVAKILSRIRSEAKQDTLLNHSEAEKLLWVWHRWTNPLEVRDWLASQINKKHALIRLAELIPSTGYRSGGSGSGEYLFVSAGYKELMDVQTFEANLRSVQEELGDQEKSVVTKYFGAEREDA